MIVTGTVVIGSSLAVFIGIIISYRTPSSCSMKIAENRDFTKYYGIVNMKNHFDTPNADECSSSIIFRPALPQMILKPDHSASSLMTLAKYGTGKTLLRCEYSRSLASNNYLKVLILNAQVTEYLNRFVPEMGVNKTHCQTHNCLISWSENEFAQLLLSTLVTEFINTYDNRKYTDPGLSLDEKINLITIICYYYNDNGTTKLESFINPFLGKNFLTRYEVDQPERKIRELTMYDDKQLLKHLEDDLKRFSILSKGYERLLLLLFILKGEGFQSRALNTLLYGKSFGDLSQFSLFIKNYLKKTPVFIVDGIDDSGFFFEEKKVNSAALESFCRSSVSQAIISTVTTGHFHLSLFYPKVDGVNVQDTIIKKDKFPTHTITWNTKSLINYADYVLQEMNKNAAKTRCTAFPDFKTLVNYSNEKIAKIIDKIPTPRALHYFMMKLIEEMNADANNVDKPFEATFENVDNAYKRSFEDFDKKTDG
jgi:hypothetical protein